MPNHTIYSYSLTNSISEHHSHLRVQLGDIAFSHARTTDKDNLLPSVTPRFLDITKLVELHTLDFQILCVCVYVCVLPFLTATPLKVALGTRIALANNNCPWENQAINESLNWPQATTNLKIQLVRLQHRPPPVLTAVATRV